MLDSVHARSTEGMPEVARVTAPLPASPADPLFVTIGAFDGGRHQHGPCIWQPAGRLPQAGDECVVARALEEDGEAEVVTVVQWGAGVTSSAAILAERVQAGNGSPEGAVSGPPGALYEQRDAIAGRNTWVKASGTGATGWRRKRAAMPYDIYLCGPESVEAAALQAPVSTTYQTPGSAFSASTISLLSGFDIRVIGCLWHLVWTPKDAACGVRLYHADPGPTSVTPFAEMTGSGSTTPINSQVFIAASTMQALFDYTAGGEIGGVNTKTVGYQTKGNGTVGPLIYVNRLQLAVEI